MMAHFTSIRCMAKLNIRYQVKALSLLQFWRRSAQMDRQISCLVSSSLVLSTMRTGILKMIHGQSSESIYMLLFLSWGQLVTGTIVA